MGQDAIKLKKACRIGFLAGGIAGLFGRGGLKAAGKDLKKMEFGTSTQKMGVSFTESLRDKFRRCWLRIGKSR
jgi:hypothetical protein